MDWILIKEQLPKEGEEVLVWCERHGRTFATYLGSNKYGTIWKFYGDDFPTFNAPTHWAILPKKPSDGVILNTKTSTEL